MAGKIRSGEEPWWVPSLVKPVLLGLALLVAFLWDPAALVLILKALLSWPLVVILLLLRPRLAGSLLASLMAYCTKEVLDKANDIGELVRGADQAGRQLEERRRMTAASEGDARQAVETEE